MLAGNWPYWDPQKIQRHPDEMLRARLNYADGRISLVEQNLEDLAEGIEGRGTNPVSLLVSYIDNDDSLVMSKSKSCENTNQTNNPQLKPQFFPVG